MNSPPEVFLHIHRNFIARDLPPLRSKSLPCGQINYIEPPHGIGFFDIHLFPDLVIARGDYTLTHPLKLAFTDPLSYYGIMIILSGHSTLTLGDNQVGITPESQSLWIRKGSFKHTETELPAHTRMCSISFDFDASLLERIAIAQPDSALLHALREKDAPSILQWQHIPDGVMDKAWQMLAITPPDNDLQTMALHGAALSLIGSLFSTSHRRDISRERQMLAARKARNIIDHDISATHNIRRLANTVGSNECDLKYHFKLLTGQTIHRYLRSQRMHQAINMLEDDRPLPHIAAALGYNSTGYFVRVFTQFFGYHPNNYTKKYKKTIDCRIVQQFS